MTMGIDYTTMSDKEFVSLYQQMWTEAKGVERARITRVYKAEMQRRRDEADRIEIANPPPRAAAVLSVLPKSPVQFSAIIDAIERTSDRALFPRTTFRKGVQSELIRLEHLGVVQTWRDARYNITHVLRREPVREPVKSAEQHDFEMCRVHEANRAIDRVYLNAADAGLHEDEEEWRHRVVGGDEPPL